MSPREQEICNQPPTGPDSIAVFIGIVIVGAVFFFLTRKKKGNRAIGSVPSEPFERWKHWKPFE